MLLSLQSGNCSIVDVVDVYYINAHVLNQNVFVVVHLLLSLGIYSNTRYIFGVRSYTDNEYGAWTFITSEKPALSPTMTIII